MAGTTWDGDWAVSATVPIMLLGDSSSLFMIQSAGSCPVVNVSRRLAPAAGFQPRIVGRMPSRGGNVSNVPGGPVGTFWARFLRPATTASAAPPRNGRPNGPRAGGGHGQGLDAEDRRSWAAVGLAGSYRGRTYLRLRG